MKKELTSKILFVAFFIVMLWFNLMLPNKMNYDNVILSKQYDIYGLDAVPASYAQVVDNESKVDDFKEFLINMKLMIFSVSFMFCIFFIVFDFKHLSATKLFLLISIPIGLIYIYLIPIGSPPDEQAHWFKAYEVSKGYFISDRDEEGLGGRKLPAILKEVVTDDYLLPSNPVTLTGVVKSYNEWLVNYENKLKSDTGEEEFIIFSNTALYSSVVYFPQAIGIAIVRAFSGSYLAQAHGARIANYLVFILVMCYAIKKLPFKKMALLLIAMLPLTYQEVTSMSIDGVQVAFSTLLISYTLYLSYDKTKEKIVWKDYAILLVSSIITAITKMLYLPLCLIIFIIPKDKFKNVKWKYISLGAIFLISALCDGVLMYGSLSYKNMYARQDASLMNQIFFILKNPMSFLDVIFLTFQKFGVNHIFGFFGKDLCWEDLDIPIFYIVSLFVITMYYLYFRHSKDEKEENIEENKIVKIKNVLTKIFMFVIAFGTSFGLVLAAYATLCPVGFAYILGIQSRYYLPLLILYSVALTKIPKTKEDFKGIEYLMMFMIFANLNTIVNIMFRYL